VVVGEDQVLDGNRGAMQWPQVVASDHRLLGHAGRRPHALGVHRADRVQPWVQRLDLSQQRLGALDR